MNDIIINDLLIENLKRIYKKEYEKSDIFCKRYYVYRYFFTKFLIDELKIKDFDLKLETSNLNYLPVDSLNMDFYQDFSKNYLKYFYVRNDIYINNLSIDEMIFLDKCVNDFNLNDNLMMDFIRNTYKKVITKNLNKNTNHKIFFGPDSLNFIANDGDVVIGVRYDEFNLNGYRDIEWNDIHDKQLDNLYKIMETIQQSSLMNVKVIKYDKYSVL